MLTQYWRASRPYSYPAALVPVLIGAAFAKWIEPDLHFHWLDFGLTLLGCCLAQAISNLVNDLADFKFGVDQPGVPGRQSALVSGDLTFRQLLIATMVICGLAALIGAYFSLKIGGPMVLLVAFGAIISVEYTAPPLKLKYRGLGDLGVFLCFGLGMSFGSYMVQSYAVTGWLDLHRLFVWLGYSLPSALLVVAILQTNNHRDREKDSHQGGKTIANMMTIRVSQTYLIALVCLPFLIVLGLIGLRIASWPLLLVAVTLPFANQLIRKVKEKDWNGVVPLAAKLDGLFGLLFSAGILIQIWRRGQ